MIDRNQCEPYQDVLDRLFEGTASESDRRRLREHAHGCPDCHALLDLHRHVRGRPLSELETEVPAEAVDGMWTRVDAEMSRGVRKAPPVPGAASVWRWVAAAQAAAIVVLAAGAIYLFGELNTMKGREMDLADRVASQQRYLAELDRRTSARASDGGWQTAGTDWTRRLGGEGDVSIAEITRYLRRLPVNAPVLDAAGARRLLSGFPAALPADDFPSPDGELRGVDPNDGLDAGEALALIEALDLDPTYRLPASRIASLARRYD